MLGTFTTPPLVLFDEEDVHTRVLGVRVKSPTECVVVYLTHLHTLEVLVPRSLHHVHTWL